VAEVAAALSVTSDLTRGHPPGEAMRACLVAVELGRRAGLDQAELTEVYYGTLMRFAGCAATSHEIAQALGGDDVIVRARGDLMDPSRPRAPGPTAKSVRTWRGGCACHTPSATRSSTLSSGSTGRGIPSVRPGQRLRRPRALQPSVTPP
jgi:hypothetical protein